jgi:chromosome segregation ATPase
MGKVYQSVRGVVQGTLNRRKPEIVVSARANGDDTDLDDAMEELEKLFADGIRKLKAAASEDQAVIANEAQQVEQVIEGLRATITGLEAKLRETEEALHSKDLASQKLAETLNTEIRDLRSALQKKDEVLEGRDSEVNDLKSNRDGLAEQVTQLELAIQQAKGEAANQAQQAEQVTESLKATITGLEAKLKETEDTLHRKDTAGQNLEETLKTEIRDLQSLVKKKDEALEGRDSELTNLKSKRDGLAEQITQLELAIQQAKVDAANQAQQAEQAIEGLKVTISGLEAKLRETEEALHSKDLASQKLAETLNTEIRDLQSAVKKKDEALEGRDSELNDLKSKSQGLAEQITQLEAIQQAKGEAASQAQHAAKVIEGLKIKIATLEAQRRQPEQMVGGIDWTIKGLDQDGDRQVTDINAELDLQTNRTKKAAGVTSVIEKPARNAVPQEAFDRLIAEFSELANVIESIASLIVRDHVRALGESMEEFPQRRLKELLESLSGQIADAKLKAKFRERIY